MLRHFWDGEELSKLSNDKSQALFALLDVKNEDELREVELTKEYIQENEKIVGLFIRELCMENDIHKIR